MLRPGEIIFNNQSSLELNLKTESYPEVELINEKYEEKQVLGRNGNVYIDMGTYDNRKVTIPFEIFSYDYEVDYERVLEWLYSDIDNRLFIDNTDKCFRVIKVIVSTTRKEFELAGSFPITFICEPFRTSNRYSVLTGEGNVYNNGNFEAKPVIEITGSGAIQLDFNEDVFIIPNVLEKCTVDVEKLECIDAQGLPMQTRGSWPVLKKGINEISYSGAVNEIKTKFLELYR